MKFYTVWSDKNWEFWSPQKKMNVTVKWIFITMNRQKVYVWGLWNRPCHLQRKARPGSVEMNANSRIKNIYKIRREWKVTCGKLYWCKRESSFCVTPELWNTLVGSFWKTSFSQLRVDTVPGGIFTILSRKKRREWKKHLGKFFWKHFLPLSAAATSQHPLFLQLVCEWEQQPPVKLQKKKQTWQKSRRPPRTSLVTVF